MSAYTDINTNPTRIDLVKFGLVFAGGMWLLGLAWLLRGGDPGVPLGLGCAGAAGLFLSLIPPIGRALYILWMGLGVTIGLVTSPVILALLYALLIVPVGLAFRAARRDAMRRGLDPSAPSYWEDYPGPEDTASYLRQF
jgi:hypothetical protein